MNHATEARQFLRSTHNAILSTHSTKLAGYPFGSVAPFVLDHACQPIVLISDIAEHTKNIIANPKVSLVVFVASDSKTGDDLQVNARLTLIGEAEKLNKNNVDLMARYCRYLPESVGYLAMHDFNFYRINILQARYIAGFGKMGWLQGSELSNAKLLTANNTIAALETDMIKHMNTDHADSLMQYCAYFYSVNPQSVTLIGIDCDGFDVEAVIEDSVTKNTTQLLRFSFESPIFDANSARMAFINLSKVAKNAG